MAIDFTANHYIEHVVTEEQVVCKWVRLACERHLRDLSIGVERGLYFDEQTARQAVAFFSLLKHSKGEWAGRPLHLEPWQQFVIASLFGWRQEDGTRRFRTSYLEWPEKRQVHDGRRHRIILDAGRWGAGRGDLLRGDEAGSGADLAQRGDANGKVVAGNTARGGDLPG